MPKNYPNYTKHDNYDIVNGVCYKALIKKNVVGMEEIVLNLTDNTLTTAQQTILG